VTPLFAADPQMQVTSPQLEGVLAPVRPNLNNEEAQELDELMSEHGAGLMECTIISTLEMAGRFDNPRGGCP
jgi:hypothetical protein